MKIGFRVVSFVVSIGKATTPHARRMTFVGSCGLRHNGPTKKREKYPAHGRAPAPAGPFCNYPGCSETARGEPLDPACPACPACKKVAHHHMCAIMAGQEDITTLCHACYSV